MKKIVLALALIGMITAVHAEKSAYVAKMKETLEEMSKCQNVEDFKRVANSFERIARIEQDEWLPLYYAANLYVQLIYIDQQASLEQKDLYLDKAKAHIQKLEEIAPGEAEVQVMKAFMVVSRIGLDPQTRGATMYADYEAILNKANELNPDNPRVKYMLLSKDVGQAQWFGQSIAGYCPKMQELYDQWDSYPVVSDIHPSWGKEQVAQLMQSCQ